MNGDDAIKRATNMLDRLDRIYDKETWVIIYNGELLRLTSGKSSWAKRNHATSALTNEMYGMFIKYRDGWEPGEVTKLLQEKGIIKIIKL